MHPAAAPPEAATLPSVERDLSSSARILLSCSIFAMMRSISDEAFSVPPPVPGSGELPVKPLEPVMKLEPPVVLVYTPDEMELRELRPGVTGEEDC